MNYRLVKTAAPSAEQLAELKKTKGVPDKISGGELGWTAAGAAGGGLLGWLLSGVVHKSPKLRTRLLYALGGAGLGGGATYKALDYIPAGKAEALKNMTLRERLRLLANYSDTEKDPNDKHVRINFSGEPEVGKGTDVEKVPATDPLDYYTNIPTLGVSGAYGLSSAMLGDRPYLGHLSATENVMRLIHKARVKAAGIRPATFSGQINKSLEKIIEAARNKDPEALRLIKYIRDNAPKTPSAQGATTVTTIRDDAMGAKLRAEIAKDPRMGTAIQDYVLRGEPLEVNLEATGVTKKGVPNLNGAKLTSRIPTKEVDHLFGFKPGSARRKAARGVGDTVGLLGLIGTGRLFSSGLTAVDTESDI